MVYIYYMKIKNFLFVFLFLCPAFVQAQVTVVRCEKNTVYLDISSSPNAVQKGDPFKVVLSTEKLTNPKTGKDLGLVYHYSPAGTITEVQPLYAVGKLPDGVSVSVGQDAVIESASPAPVSPALQEPEKTKTAGTHRRVVTFAPVEQEIISLSAADITRPGAENIVTLSAKGTVSVWKRNGENLELETTYQLPKGKKPVSLSAGAVRGKDTAEIFVVLYDASTERLSTQVLAYEKGAWISLASIPYFVKELGCTPEKTVWMQKPFVLGSRPGNAHNLIYAKDRFQAGEQTLPTQRNWLSGTALAEVEKAGQKNFLYTAVNGKIKMQLLNGKNAESKNLFASSPNRVQYKQELLKFYPSLQTVHSQNKTEVAAVENTTKYGLLSSAFGMYQSGKIHFLSYEKGRLNVTDTVELDGFVYDTACTAQTVLTAEVLPDGQSSVVEIFN